MPEYSTPFGADPLGAGSLAVAPDFNQCLQYFRAIGLGPESIAEVRALGVQPNPRWRSHIESGYFDDPECAAREATRISTVASGVYATLNEITPALLARRKNRLGIAEQGSLTTAGDVVRRRRVCFDIDPVRPKGVSATAGERDEARKVAGKVIVWIREVCGQDPWIIDTGNGYHLYYGVDLPSADGDRVKALLQAAHSLHSSSAAVVDTTVFDPARIVRVPGTLNRKGDSTPDRPHRLVRFVSGPGGGAC